MSLIDDAISQIGETFIIGFEGKELSDDTAAFLSQAKIGGVLLFAKNYESPEQVARLINSIQECRADLPLWITVDQEGGLVQRFKSPFTLIPTAEEIAKVESTKYAFEISQVIAKELKAVGVNVNFNPVADILTNPKNKVIGNRAYGTDEESVSRRVTAIVRGHVTNGIQPCVKHFPGHGDTDIDSHDDLPTVDTPLEVLQDREFRPFTKAGKSRCNMLMVAHIIYTALDKEFPASLSKKILRGILRQELRYTRLVISDDLEMGAITKNYGADIAPILALDAGNDLIIYRTEAAARKAYEAVRKAVESGKLSPAVILEAAQRSRQIKETTLLPYQPTDPNLVKSMIGTPEHLEAIKNTRPVGGDL